eukprot:883053-Rhodomonas_salina.7
MPPSTDTAHGPCSIAGELSPFAIAVPDASSAPSELPLPVHAAVIHRSRPKPQTLTDSMMYAVLGLLAGLQHQPRGRCVAACAVSSARGCRRGRGERVCRTQLGR